MGVEIHSTNLQSVLIIVPQRFEDHRGFFEETWSVAIHPFVRNLNESSSWP